jgi:hypothetical protein
VNDTDSNGWTVLHDAVLGGHAEMVDHVAKIAPGKSCLYSCPGIKVLKDILKVKMKGCHYLVFLENLATLTLQCTYLRSFGAREYSRLDAVTPGRVSGLKRIRGGHGAAGLGEEEGGGTERQKRAHG